MKFWNELKRANNEKGKAIREMNKWLDEESALLDKTKDYIMTMFSEINGIDSDGYEWWLDTSIDEIKIDIKTNIIKVYFKDNFGLDYDVLEEINNLFKEFKLSVYIVCGKFVMTMRKIGDENV